MFVVLLLLTASLATPVEKLKEQVEHRSVASVVANLKRRVVETSLLQQCLSGQPLLLEVANLPASGRQLGDVCRTDAQCAFGLQCVCQSSGGKQCSNVPQPCFYEGVIVPADGQYHNIECEARCRCEDDGSMSCVSMCPPSMMECPSGILTTIPADPDNGKCCDEYRCELPPPPPPPRGPTPGPYGSGTVLNWQSWQSSYQVTAGVTVLDLWGQMAHPESGYCFKALTTLDNLSNQIVCGGSSSSIGSSITLEWDQECEKVGSFRAGVDWGLGGAIIVDGNIVASRNTDQWWNANWDAAIETPELTFAAGRHLVQFIGFEGCCDGAESFQYRAQSGDWQVISSDFNLGSCAVSPVHPPVAPIEPPVAPIEPPTEPIEPPVEPIEPPVEPIEPPTEPIEPPTEPIEPPVAPIEPPVAPIEPPVAPIEPPVAPIEPPTEPIEPPVAPIEPPVAPIEPPTEPIEPPVAPIEPPVVPIEPPVAPIEPPVLPSPPHPVGPIRPHGSGIWLNWQSWSSNYQVQGGISVYDLVGQVRPSEPGYCTKDLHSLDNLSNGIVCGGSNGNIGSLITVEWDQDCEKTGYFRAGVDWGLGGAIVFDDQVVASRAQDVWWAGNWGLGIETPELTFAPGRHVIQFFGFEGCCDGAEQFQYRESNGDWRVIDASFSFGDCVPVEPPVDIPIHYPFGSGTMLTWVSQNSGYAMHPGATVEEILAQVRHPGSDTRYCAKKLDSLESVSNQIVCGGSSTDIGSAIIVSWDQHCEQLGSFRAGVDWGRGGAIIVDGNLVASRAEDVWWAGNWGAGIETPQINFAPGRHVVQFYGFEGCCDGAEQFQFKSNGGDWTVINTSTMRHGFGSCPTKMTWESWSSTYQVQGPSPNGEDLISQIQPPTPGYCKKPLTSLSSISNQNVCGGSNSNIGSSITITWEQECDQFGSFRFGVDWGLGGGVFIDGHLTYPVIGDHWWAVDWGNSQVIVTEEQLFRQGSHTLQLIGFEGCCDGAEQFEYRAHGGDWKVIDQAFCFGGCVEENPAPAPAPAPAPSPAPEPAPAPAPEPEPEPENPQPQPPITPPGPQPAPPCEIPTGGFGITWESFWTNYQVGSVGAADLIAQVHVPTDGYCKKSLSSLGHLSNQAICGGTYEAIGQSITVDWIQRCEAVGSFRFGVDWGYGGGIVIDGVLVASIPADASVNWWNGDWNAASGVITVTDHRFAKGPHRMQIIGFEPCCDGVEQVQFKNNGGDWQVLDDSFVQGFGNCASLNWQSWPSRYEVHAGVSADELLNEVHGESAGYCTKDLSSLEHISNQIVCAGSASNIGSLITLEWNQKCEQMGSFRLGIDWGFGGAVIIDGVVVTTVPTNEPGNWWAQSWGSGDVVTVPERLYAAGHHKVQFIGFEPCCDGPEVIQGKAQSGDWFTVTDTFSFAGCYVPPVIPPPVLPPVQPPTPPVKPPPAPLASLKLTWQSWESTYEVPSGGVTAHQLKTQIHPSGPGYCTRQLDSFATLGNQAVCGGANTNIGQSITIEWHQECEEFGQFRMGVDWGKGGGIIIDGQLVAHFETNIPANWWAGNWDNQGVIVAPEHLFFRGWHKVQFIGFEGCCDGTESIQFRGHGGDWTFVDRDFRLGSCEPEPGVSMTWQSWNSHYQVSPNPDPHEILAQISEPSAGYCRQTLEDFSSLKNSGICPGGVTTDMGQVTTLEWYQLCDQFGQFRMGVDWGAGGAIFLDGELVLTIPTNVNGNWWNGNWDAGSPNVLTLEEREYKQGWHKIQFVGFEPCCDGNQTIQFKNRVGDWKVPNEGFCFGPCEDVVGKE